MNELNNQIGARIRELREILDILPADIAKRVGVSPEYYEQLENHAADMPISMLYEVANLLGVDPTVLMTGEAPRMDSYTIVRGGNGASIERYPGYSFSALAANYQGRQMQPMLVTINHKDGQPELVTHGGQEFNYVVKGSIYITIGKHEFLLGEGDSIYFNPTLPHGQRAASAEAKFLTVINE